MFSNTTDDVIATLEEFVCCLYGDLKIKKVDELRVKLFQTRFNGDGKNIDLISLPPCYSNLRLHIDCTCYVANMLDDPVEHGWDLNGKVKWSEKCFPDDLSDLLISNDKTDCDNDADNDFEVK